MCQALIFSNHWYDVVWSLLLKFWAELDNFLLHNFWNHQFSHQGWKVKTAFSLKTISDISPMLYNMVCKNLCTNIFVFSANSCQYHDFIPDTCLKWNFWEFYILRIGVFAIFKFLYIQIIITVFSKILCCNFHFSETSVKWQLQLKNRYFLCSKILLLLYIVIFSK